MDFAEALQYLLSLGHETLAVKLGLENTRRMLDALGRPHDRFTAVQIAGTNGKGSTAAMLAAAARAAGLRTGLYTSPHLVSITERIRIDGRDVTPEEFARCATEVRAVAEHVAGETGALPTFFEQVTAAALVAFRAARVELAVLETGLGGRLDATTAVRAPVVAITPVAIDHQEYLGQTLAEIAAEKAAIIRPGVSAVVIAPQAAEALAVIEARCRECGVAPRLAARDMRVRGADPEGRLRIDLVTRYDMYEDLRLALRGRHQAANAATAVELAEHLREGLGFPLTRRAIIEGLARAEHPGRLELIEGAPRFLLDGAHNAAGARALREYLDEFAGDAYVTLVFGAMRDKQLDEMAAALFPAAERVVLTRAAGPRSAEPETLSALAPATAASGRITLARTAAEALAAARRATPPGGIVCVTGSLYLVGEVKALLAGRGE